jgi:hypothetical protein
MCYLAAASADFLVFTVCTPKLGPKHAVSSKHVGAFPYRVSRLPYIQMLSGFNFDQAKTLLRFTHALQASSWDGTLH